MAYDPSKPLTAAERKMLIHNPKARAQLEAAGMSELDLRRVAQEQEREEARQRHFANKVTTRADVLSILDMYTKRQIVPFAIRLDAAEAALEYLTAPWWMRRVYDFRRWRARLRRWLAAIGVFVHVGDVPEDQPPEGGEDSEAQDPD